MIVELCANGWVIRPNPRDRCYPVELEKVWVFNSWPDAQKKLHELVGGEPKVATRNKA